MATLQSQIVARSFNFNTHSMIDTTVQTFTYFPIYSCIAYAVDQKTVRIRFKEDKRKTYSIQWTELLTPREIPFENLDVLTPGTEVLAPYTVEGEGVQYSTAVVVSDSAVGEKKSKPKGMQHSLCVRVH